MSGKTLISLFLLAGVAGSFAGLTKRSIPISRYARAGEGEPKITYSKDTVGKAGEEVTLDCAVEGVDLKGVDGFGVSWAKIDLEKPMNSYPISAGEKILLFSSKYRIEHPKDSYKYSLVIKNINEEDTGTYRCTVNFGSDQKINAEVPVFIEKAPYFTDNLTKTLTVKEGDAISIDCQPGGSPKPDVYWERVNDELPYYGGKFFKANQFDIPQIERSHVGHYVCHADNGLGVPATSHVILAVQYKPDMKVTTEEVFAQVRDSGVELECHVMADPVADLTWYKGEQAILGSANIKVAKYEENEGLGLRSTLTFEEMSEDDFGVYACTSENVIGKTVGEASIKMKSPPVITKQSGNEVLYNLDDSLSPNRGVLPIVLECEAEGGPKPEFRWTKNSIPIVWQADPRIELETGTGNLLIERPTMDDNGRYQCLAYNGQGTALADPIHLLNTTHIRFEATSKPEFDVEAELGRPFKLSCPQATAYPKPTYKWMKTYASPEPGQIALDYADNDRTTADPEGNLWFTHITEEDDSVKNNFKYMCLAVTSFSPQDLSLGTTINMNVTLPADDDTNHNETSLNIESFLMYSSPSDVNVTAAEENTLWCIFGGEPAPKVTWKRKDGQELDESRFVTRNYGRTLVMKDTVAADSGEYECQATNGVGEVKSKQFKVAVDVVPAFKDNMVSQTVQEGATVTFTCATESTEEVKYQWQFNGRILESGNARRKMVEDKLVLTGVSTADIGNYACNATSSLGYAYGQAALIVIPGSRRNPYHSCEGMYALSEEVKSPPVITKQSGNEVLYNLDDSISPVRDDVFPTVLECEAEGEPKPEYRWTKNSIPIVWQADPRIKLETGTGNLLIERPTMEDNGRYQCLAYNGQGTALADPIHLLNTTHIRFEATSKPEFDVEAELGRPFKLSCPQATAYPKPTYTWMKTYASPEPGQIALDYADNDRTTTDPEGNLWFTHITEEDDSVKNNFKYMCLAATSFSPQDLSLGTTINMNVTLPADDDPNHNETSLNIESFLMYSSPSDVNVTAAEENTLWCIFVGEPAPKVTWKRKDGQELDESRFVTRNYGRTLVMKDTVAADSGEYECQATNGVGEVKSKQFNVAVYVAPAFKDNMVSQTVKQGATVTFTCATESTEEVKYQWYYNGRILESGNSRRTMVEEKLVMTDVSTADIGNYACNATSSLGYAYDQAALIVISGTYSHRSCWAPRSCEGMDALSEEVSMLKMVVHELKDMIKDQHELLMHTHSHMHDPHSHTHPNIKEAVPMKEDMKAVDMVTVVAVEEEETATESFRSFKV